MCDHFKDPVSPRLNGAIYLAKLMILVKPLHRKEVIQPQVPLRLPCYDFIPITKFTFGHVIADFGCSRLS